MPCRNDRSAFAHPRNIANERCPSLSSALRLPGALYKRWREKIIYMERLAELMKDIGDQCRYMLTQTPDHWPPQMYMREINAYENVNKFMDGISCSHGFEDWMEMEAEVERHLEDWLSSEENWYHDQRMQQS